MAVVLVDPALQAFKIKVKVLLVVLVAADLSQQSLPKIAGLVTPVVIARLKVLLELLQSLMELFDTLAVAVGKDAGLSGQSIGSVAIGCSAGAVAQDVGAVAVMGFGVLALLAGAWVIFLVFGMEVSL
jgi:hypothetical protein